MLSTPKLFLTEISIILTFSSSTYERISDSSILCVTSVLLVSIIAFLLLINSRSFLSSSVIRNYYPKKVESNPGFHKSP